LFENGNFRASVEYYSISNKSFEEVALKFLKSNLYDPLQEYLVRVLRKY
jgi:hypothetical protein